MRKEVQNQVRSSNLNLCIIDSVRDSGKLPILKLSKTARQYYISRLKKDCILIKKGYGVWAINEEVLKAKTSSKSSEVGKAPLNIKLIRGHGFQFVLKIPCLPKWDKRATFLSKHKIPYTTFPQGISFVFRDHKVWLCKDSIVVYFPDWKNYYESTLDKSKKSAVYDFLSLVTGLSNLLKADLSFKGDYMYRCSRQHFAKVKDVIAKSYNDSKKKLEVRGSDGKVWLITDKSLKVDELEFIHSKHAVPDGDSVVIPFLNDLRDHYQKTGETLLFSNILQSLSIIADNQRLYGDNALKHVDVINKLSDAVDELRLELKNRKGI